ncbi:hypothetical protein [Streptomyces fuscichromogenes]|uniref:Uncharacterized protein n=1 Tax=Streptomyces fuscichromogenes TaxID=1324013 RepID=A0A917XPQ5_9ACTN|nr:hypothetical protein [Streptomyces fuscichromogenes]GGN47808.1 hypothetical protein GCM10011578_101600 [Streptomyces fuscichromogenes]
MAYATAEQFRLFIRHSEPFTDEETAQAEFLLDLAGACIEEETGQPLEESTDTVILDGNGARKLVLPKWPVTAVSSVTVLHDLDDDEVLTFGADHDYTWSASGTLTRRCACWPKGERNIEAVVTAGLATLPMSLTRVALRLCVGPWSNPNNLASESLGDLSRSYNTATDLGMELSSSDRKLVAVYTARTQG